MIDRKILFFLLILVTALTAVSVEAQTRRRTAHRSGPPALSLTADQTVITTCESQARVHLAANATSGAGAALRYKWTANGGKITGNGADTIWDLSGERPGVYQAVVDVDEGDDNCASFASIAVVVNACPPPIQTPPSCPTVTVSCPDSATENAPVTFNANVTGGFTNGAPTLTWTITARRITSGQGTETISVGTSRLAGPTIRPHLAVGGFAPSFSSGGPPFLPTLPHP